MPAAAEVGEIVRPANGSPASAAVGVGIAKQMTGHVAGATDAKVLVENVAPGLTVGIDAAAGSQTLAGQSLKPEMVAKPPAR